MTSHRLVEKIRSTQRFIIMKYGPIEHKYHPYHGFGTCIVTANQTLFPSF